MHWEDMIFSRYCTVAANTVRNFQREVFRFYGHVFKTCVLYNGVKDAPVRMLYSIEILPNGSLTDTGRPRNMSSRLLTKMAATLDGSFLVYTAFLCGICDQANFYFRANLFSMCRTALSLRFQFRYVEEVKEINDTGKLQIIFNI